MIINDGYSLLDVMDNDSQTMYELHQALYVRQHQFRKSVCKIMDPIGVEPSTLLYLKELQIEEKHRGHGVGLLAMNSLIEEMHSHCPLVVLQAYPLQDNDDEDVRDSTEIQKGQNKLMRHYRKIGFRKVHDNYMAVHGWEIRDLAALFPENICSM